MSTEKWQDVQDPFWDIVEGTEISKETLALVAATGDNYIRANVELQYDQEFNEQALQRHYGHLIKYLDTTYALPPSLAQVIFDYHHAQINDSGLAYG